MSRSSARARSLDRFVSGERSIGTPPTVLKDVPSRLLTPRRSRSRSSDDLGSRSTEGRLYSSSPSCSLSRSRSRTRSRSRSRSRSRKHTRGSSANSSSPSKERRGGRKRLRSPSVDLIPEPPEVPEPQKRKRVKLSSAGRRQFEGWAAGERMPTAERASLLKELPLVDSVFAQLPVTDLEMANLIKDKKDKDYLSVNGTDLRLLHENVLNVLMLQQIISLGLTQGARSESLQGYLELAGRLLSGSLHIFVAWNREIILRQLQVTPREAMPSYFLRPLPDSTTATLFSSEERVQLFGKELVEELAKSDTSLRKAIEKLRADRQKPKVQSRNFRPATVPSQGVSRGRQNYQKFSYKFQSRRSENRAKGQQQARRSDYESRLPPRQTSGPKKTR